MAANDNNKASCWSVPEVYKHHEQRKICISRPKYREGRRAKAVKVYTINLESRYVMVQGVPAIGVMTELVQLCALYGVVEEYRPLDEYPAEEFTEVYLVKFQRLTSARAAKRHMDEKSFYGGVLHVCYVPEYESVEDTRLKLQDRRSYIMRTFRNKARERAKREASTGELVPSDAVTAPPDGTGQDKTLGNDDTETSNTCHNSSFPLLPLPPREYRTYRDRAWRGGDVPTEDKMGTLHNAVIETKRQPGSRPSPSRAASSRAKVPERRDPPKQPAAPRFVPRTTHLESRKRRMQQQEEEEGAAVRSGTEGPGSDERLIRPRLPEPPKLDMEDESLNTTVSLIRSTLKKVESAADFKPVEKKVKPRRRI